MPASFAFAAFVRLKQAQTFNPKKTMVGKMETNLGKGAKRIGIQAVLLLLLTVMTSPVFAGKKDSEEKFGFGGMWTSPTIGICGGGKLR